MLYNKCYTETEIIARGFLEKCNKKYRSPSDCKNALGCDIKEF